MARFAPFCLAAFLATVFVDVVLAQTYHVAPAVSGASDANDGLAPTFVSGVRGPWQTLRHAGQTATAGATVLVHDGDFRDESTGFGVGVIPIQNSGTESAPLRFRAAAGALPVINTLLIHSRQWVEIEGLVFESRDFSLPTNWQDMPAIVVDQPGVVIDPSEDWSARQLAVRQKFSTYMAMQDFFFSNYTNGIDVKDSADITIRANSISLYTFGIQVRSNCSDVTIENNTITHCADGVFTWRPIPALTDGVIRGNTIRQCFNNGIFVREGCERVVIESNDVQMSGTSHISLLGGCTRCTIRGNLAMGGGYYSETMRNPGSSAINVHSCESGNVVERNFAAYHIDLTGNDGNGFIADLMLGGAGVLYRNNIAYRNMGSGLRTTVSPNCWILNNTFAENGYQSSDPRDGSGIGLARE